MAGRLYAGRALALCAFARPADPYRGPADYALLVQERSGNLVNATRQLAVIPKGFHQPLSDFRGDAKIGATLRREMEEELFGRQDIDNTLCEQHAADLLHPRACPRPCAGSPRIPHTTKTWRQPEGETSARTWTLGVPALQVWQLP